MPRITFSESLQTSWDNYDRDARKRVEECSRGALALIGEFSVALQNAIEDIEMSQLFSSLLENVQHEIASRGHHNKCHISFWRNALRNVLRRSGYYSHIARSSRSNSKVELQRIMASFDKRDETVTYMAPMEYVSLEQAHLQFPTFAIQKFNKVQLDHIFSTAINELHFPWAVIDTTALSDYWFVIAKEKLSIRPLGEIPIDLGSIGKVDIRYSPFPVLENTFQRLALFDWQPDYGRYEKPGERPEWQGWLGPKIPFSIRLSDNLLSAPQRAPIIISELEMEPTLSPLTNEEWGEHPARYINLDEAETQSLASFIRHTDRLISSIGATQEVWPFLARALGFHVKGFFTKGLEQLLWHITVLEALFGEDSPGTTRRLAKRIATVLGRSIEEQKQVRKRFEELYEFRSRLVHGDEFKKQIWEGHLREARDMASRSLLWFINFAKVALDTNRTRNPTDLPNREELLALLDLQPKTVARLGAIIHAAPSSFPAINAWSDTKMASEK